MSESYLSRIASCQQAFRSSSGKVDTTRGQLRHNEVSVIWPAEPSDVDIILEDGLRQQDLDELAALGREPEEALRGAFESCGVLVFTVHVNDRPVAMFGAAPYLADEEADIGVVWMLGTDGLLGARRLLLVEAPKWINLLMKVYPILTNYVDERNSVSIRWLERMGFEFPYTDDFVTDQGITFRRFVLCATQ